MAEKVRQHTVPKVYLKNFGTARKKNTYVYVYDKDSQNIFQSEISNVSVERNFYRLEAASDPLAVEDFYSRFVEPQTGEVIAEIIKKANLVMFANNATKDASPFAHGLSSNTTVVYYPLSDKLMLALYSYEYADGILNRFDSGIVRLEAAKEKRFIQLVNSLQLNQCKKQAFAKSLASFTSIIE